MGIGRVVVRAVKWLAGRLLRLVPERLLGRLLPGAYRFDPERLPPPPIAPETAIRLYIAPANYAGQGRQWARAVERHIPDAGAVNMALLSGSTFRHPADEVVPLGFYAASRRWQRAQREAVSSGFTHVMVEAEKHPFGATLDETVVGQVRALQRAGLRVLMVCHGTDIRLPSRHIARYPDSPFLDAMKGLAPRLERAARRNRRILDELGLPVFVTTPDLTADVPYARWLPPVVDLEQWRFSSPPLLGERPVVVHAPSAAAAKGSESIDPILSRLDAEGLVSYRRLTAVPSDRMPDAYHGADIVIDQIRLGDYGVAAIEAMAAGRVVVGHVSDHSREYLREQTGQEVPIVEARAERLEEVIRDIVAERERYRTIAAEGVEFVRRIHDGRRSAEVLAPFLG